MGSITQDPSKYDIDILIIGGGFSGCYALHKLRQLKPAPTIKIVEAGSDFGGVWYYNRYPGARTDTEWRSYQLSVPELWKDWQWTEKFSGDAQIRDYFKHMDDVLGLSKDTFFNTTVVDARWDGENKRWNSSTQDGKSFTSRYLIICTGSSYKTHIPAFKGLELFTGPCLHSTSFPENSIDVAGKRVGVIGSGATGVQIVQELAKEDCQLTNFIRTPNNAIPMRQRHVTWVETNIEKQRYPENFEYMKTTHSGMMIPPNPLSFQDATDEQKQKILERLWMRGGFHYILGGFREYLRNKEANAYCYQFWAERVRKRIKDPEKRDIMAPIPQQNWFALKRPSLEQDYYEMIDQSNVKLVNLKKTPIREIAQRGVITEDGTLHEVDILILATGYDALNGSQKAIGLHDKDGVPLTEKWSKGTVTYLGLAVPGLPNCFFSYGAQSPAALGNGVMIIEVEVDWMYDAIQKMEDGGIETVDPQLDVSLKWGKDIQDMSEMCLFGEEDSWWIGANIPGKVREQLNYLGGLAQYQKEIYGALDGWKGFDVVEKTR